jgi:hypothetical protein
VSYIQKANKQQHIILQATNHRNQIHHKQRLSIEAVVRRQFDAQQWRAATRLLLSFVLQSQRQYPTTRVLVTANTKKPMITSIDYHFLFGCSFRFDCNLCGAEQQSWQQQSFVDVQQLQRNR